MRHEAIKKRGGQWVRIRPALQVYDQSAVLLQTVEDAWFISEITQESLKLKSRDTDHARVIGLDHIHNYMEDPEGQRTLGTTGVLVMNVQLLLYDGALLAEPVAPPGTHLKTFVPAKPRASLLNAAARMRAHTDLERARREFAWSMTGVKASDAAFAEIPRAVEALRDELRGAGQPIDISVKAAHGNIFLLGVAGWWVSFQWQRAAANCLDGSRLTVTQWDGHPEMPGMMLLTFETANRVGSDTYGFGLAALNQPRWLHESNPEVSYTTADLVQDVLTRLLQHPNDRRR